MAAFTSDELIDLRTRVLRDRYVAATTSPVAAAIAVSHYNRAVKANYVSDTSIQALKTKVENDREEELLTLYNQKYYERLTQGDSDADAITKATTAQTEALYRLVRAEVLESQIDDAGFQGSIADERLRATMTAQMLDQLQADRTFVFSRAGGYGAARLRFR